MSLESHFTNMWQEVSHFYSQGKICSERHLQAVIYHLLVAQKDFTAEYSISIEPKITGDEKFINNFELLGIIPDMIISKEKEIMAVVEIKYVPHDFIPFKKDIKNLAKFWRLKNNPHLLIHLDINPSTGMWNKDKMYSVHPNMFLIYCAIGNHESYVFKNHKEIWDFRFTGLDEQMDYLILTGAINKDSEPEFKYQKNVLPLTTSLYKNG